MKDKRRDLRSYRNKVAQAKHRATVKANAGTKVLCWICQDPIDMSLPYYDRMAWTADHVEALAAGGHILGPLLDAHRKCNSGRGKGNKEEPLNTTRDW